MDDFIELNRTFYQLSADYTDKAKSDDLDITKALEYGVISSLNWEELLSEYRVVLLAEAGAGKTQEIRHTTEQLRSEGKPAFFMRLEHLATDFELAFEIGTYQEFLVWLDSDEEGWILLDSVDEARLKSPKDFELAIRRLATRIASSMQRSHIVVTSRITAWKPKTDLNFCNERFPFEIPGKESDPLISDEENNIGNDNVYFSPTIKKELKLLFDPNSKNENRGFKVYTLKDLSNEQVEIFILAKGITDSFKLGMLRR